MKYPNSALYNLFFFLRKINKKQWKMNDEQILLIY
jgi:hypothetical protein